MDPQARSPALFAVVHSPGPRWDKSKQFMSQPGIDRHVDHLTRIFRDGGIVMGGPFEDGAGGLVIMKAHSLDEARRMAESDPSVESGVLAVTVRHWRIVASSVGL